VLERSVDRAVQEQVRGDEHEQMAAGAQALAEGGQCGAVVADVLEHVEAGDRVERALDHGRRRSVAAQVREQGGIRLDRNHLAALGEPLREGADPCPHLEHLRTQVRAGAVEQPRVVAVGLRHPVQRVVAHRATLTYELGRGPRGTGRFPINHRPLEEGVVGETWFPPREQAEASDALLGQGTTLVAG
jgi:hypothetical protein